MPMPAETQVAVAWALQQDGVTVDESSTVVDAVRQYFNSHSIPYETFSYDDLAPYL